MQSARELVNRVFEKPPYIIEEGILNENSIMVIGGPPKAYKSFFSQAIALHLATGTNLFGAHRKHAGMTSPAFGVVAPKRVLILEQEIGDWSFHERLRDAAAALSPASSDLFLDNIWTHSCDRDLRLDTAAGTQAIGNLMDKWTPDVLMLDPLIEFHQQDENSSQHMIGILRNLDYLREHFKCAVVLNHHASKSEDRTGPDNLRGSSALYGKGDSFFMLKVSNRNAGLIGVDVTIRRDKPIRPFSVKLDWIDKTCKFVEWGKLKEKENASQYREYVV